MKKFNEVVDFIAGNMALLTIIVAVFCLAKPEAVIPFAKVKIGSLSITNVLLMVIMFGMGTTLKADDFKLILKRPFEVFRYSRSVCRPSRCTSLCCGNNNSSDMWLYYSLNICQKDGCGKCKIRKTGLKLI